GGGFLTRGSSKTFSYSTCHLRIVCNHSRNILFVRTFQKDKGRNTFSKYAISKNIGAISSGL
uniref:hypothetical protein n=1 Tax=Alloprevotella sp. TaxID=1872471 RepID=UPI004027A5FE